MSILLEDPDYYPEHVALGTADGFHSSLDLDWSQVDCYALWSGGYESLVAAYEAMEHGDAQAVLHLDTTTGVPENEQMVVDTCEEFGWPLRIERAPITLYEFATGKGPGDRSAYGFPGAGAHQWAYSWLKERGMRRPAKQADGKPRYLTGVRKAESDRRKMNVSTEPEEVSQWIWEAPIAEYQDWEVEDTMQDAGLPTSPVVEAIDRSGECWCMAYGSRDEALIDLRAGGFDDHADRLLDLEERVQEEIGTQEDHCWIGHGKASEASLRALKAQEDTCQMKLCQDCQRNYPTESTQEDDGDDDDEREETEQVQL